MAVVVTASTYASAFQFGAAAGRSSISAPALSAATPALFAPAALPASANAARTLAPLMQTDFYDGYVETDPVTGAQKALQLDEKEKLYLECLDAFYNEDGKQLLSNEEYEQLKSTDFGRQHGGDLQQGRSSSCSNKRFKMGKPTLSDPEYDALREKLQGRLRVVLHDGASATSTLASASRHARRLWQDAAALPAAASSACSLSWRAAPSRSHACALPRAHPYCDSHYDVSSPPSARSILDGWPRPTFSAIFAPSPPTSSASGSLRTSSRRSPPSRPRAPTASTSSPPSATSSRS